jgi:Family of unknown function (DUF5677)
MTEEPFPATLNQLVDAFHETAGAAVRERWTAWKLDLTAAEVHEVVGGLLARQATLANHLVATPNLWTQDLGTIVLRSMADVYVTIAWILEDSAGRARRFIRYALGQAKLRLEQKKAWAAAFGVDPAGDPMIKAEQQWIDGQRWSFLTDVDLGSWAGKNTRDMASEAGCLDFYEDVYQAFSNSTHSTWFHVERFNLSRCDEVLHRYHRIPCIPPIRPDLSVARLAAKYLDKSLSLFDGKTGVSVETPSLLAVLDGWFERLAAPAADKPLARTAAGGAHFERIRKAVLASGKAVKRRAKKPRKRKQKRLARRV